MKAGDEDDASSLGGAHQTEALMPATSGSPPPGLRTLAVDSAIFLVWAILEIVDVLLLILAAVWRRVDDCVATTRPGRDAQHVVIVGASFGGLAAQRELSGRRDVKVTLIDFKSYFEYTPGVLRCFVQPDFLKQLTCPLPASRNELVHGEMTAATEEAVVMRDAEGTESQIPFDYLILAVGSTYADPIKPLASEPTLAERASSWNDAAAKLRAANTVIIVGAGPVGVELAGEILTVYPDKALTFVDMAPTILPGFDEAAASYTKAWFAARGAEMRLGEGIEEIRAQSLLLKSGEMVEADVVYKCVGVMPNTQMLKASPVFSNSFGFRDSIEVNDHLQVAGNPKIYCVGDMMSHASRELKLGHTAEVCTGRAALAPIAHGRAARRPPAARAPAARAHPSPMPPLSALVAAAGQRAPRGAQHPCRPAWATAAHLSAWRHGRRLDSQDLVPLARQVLCGRRLQRARSLRLVRNSYQPSQSGSSNLPWPSIAFHRVRRRPRAAPRTFRGRPSPSIRYVAVLKWLLEWTKVAAAAERPIGILFWKVAIATDCH